MTETGPLCRQCPHCLGSGRVRLSKVYAETLGLLRGVNPKTTDTTGANLARLAGCKPTAMNNRLSKLETFGLAVSFPCGRKRFYRAV